MGNFAAGALGGLGGAIAGNILYDQFGRPHHAPAPGAPPHEHSAAGVFPPTAPGPGQEPPRETFDPNAGATGDWGGGFAIGKEVLWHASRDEDGRGPATLLTDLAARHFGYSSAVEIATGMHLGTIDRDRTHELVPLLFAAVDAGDSVAAGVVQRQAEEIALLATTTIRRIDALDAPIDVVLGGGMLTSRHPALIEPVLERIGAVAPGAVVSIITDAPIVGSALLGLERLDALVGQCGSALARRERLRATLAPPHEVRA